jgi:cytochrome c-type biogenesis protein CcmH/NrfG
MWESTAVAAVGLAAGAIAATGDAAPRGGLASARWCLVAVALVAALTQLPGLASTKRVRASQDAVRDGRLDRARDLATSAVEAQPWAASPYVQRALVAEREGALRSAVVDLERAIDREHTNWKHWLVLSRVLGREGRAGKAVSAYRRARVLRPEAAVFAVDREPPAANP